MPPTAMPLTPPKLLEPKAIAIENDLRSGLRVGMVGTVKRPHQV
jgi:hypothetical protein